MRIGLLEAETLPDKVVKQYGSYGDMFQRLLAPAQPNWQFQTYPVDRGELPNLVDDCDAYIITGSRHNAYDRDDWIEDLKAFIREIDNKRKKCLAICFGHQVVAEALGGKVEKSHKGWGIGPADFNILATPTWMTQKPQKFTILVSHQDQVIKEAANATVFAGNDFCPIGGMNIGNHFLTLQGHPEFTPTYLSRLIAKRRQVIGDEKSDKSLKLLDKYQQDPLPLAIIRDFFAA